ncbi:hypothetical protein [Roseomonas sp. CECT 9278]|uniref:hypothetical protein n=1 Tax=Roseomonas sp. CECT 9278 TaxID=2845823 RepID=UPI001E286C42|nr:hypothetical protein [Roseomonas sp. CECT 9278]CAH0166327.1 hypothetical protein ROS9278_01086 [Roseomonas sp. CECT 9278]
MTFAITWTVAGDIGPGTAASLGGTLQVDSAERLADTVAANTTRSFAFLPVPPARLRLLAIAANDYRSLALGLNGAAPSRPITGPEVMSGAMLDLVGGGPIHTIAFENTGPEDVAVEILLCRDP